MGIDLSVHRQEGRSGGQHLHGERIEHAMAVIEGQDKVVIGKRFLQASAEQFRASIVSFLFADHVNLEHFLKRVLLNKSAFHDRWLILQVKEGRIDLRIQTGADELFIGIGFAEKSEQIDVVAKGSEMVRGGDRSAREALCAQMARGKNRLLARFPHRLAIFVFINNRFANEQDFQIFRALEITEDFVD